MNIAAIVPAIVPLVEEVLEGKGKADEKAYQIAAAAAGVVVAEAQGESWLQRNWRPLMMLWFAFLIGGYWFGFVPTNMPVEIVSQMFNLVTLGIGGYIAGRTGEKIVKDLAPVLGRKRG